MLRDAPSGGGRAQLNGRCRAPGRVWHAPAPKAIPAEPGWAVTVAAVSTAREAEDLYRWHDGAETSANVLRRALWRFAHGRRLPDGSKSGRFACAFPELVHALGRAGLFPKAGDPPRYDPRSEQWQEYLKKTRTQARRLCDRLETARVATVTPERDNLGRDWRVVVELLEVEVDATRLGEAKRRHRRGAWQRRRDRSEARGVQRDLRAIARAARPLTRAEKARLSKEFAQRSRGLAEHEGDLCNQREASRPSDAQLGVLNEETFASTPTSHRRGAHAHGIRSLRDKDSARHEHDRRPARADSWPEAGPWASERGRGSNGADLRGAPGSERPSGVQGRFVAGSAASRDRGAAWGVEVAQIAFTAPTADLLSPAVAAVLTAAWWRMRRGLPSTALPVVEDKLAATRIAETLRHRAGTLEMLADHRPAGWPTSGAAMVLTLALVHDLSPASHELVDAVDGLLELMRGDRYRHPIGPGATPPAGYEGVATMRLRLADQLAAAGDSIDVYPTLRAAEAAARDHERTGRLAVGRDFDADMPWNRDKPRPILWPSPSVQRSWRHRLLPPLPQVAAAAAVPATPPRLDRLAEPATYERAIANVQGAPRGVAVSGLLAEDLVNAFHARRYGVAGAIAKRDWRPRPKGGLREIQAVVDAYEALADLRPNGWPASGAAAILVTATWRDPGSYQHDGTPVRLNRPEHLPMALGLMRVLIDNMQRLAKRDAEIAAGKSRRRGRGGRSPEHRARKAAKQAAEVGPRRLQFRFPASSADMPPLAETPAETYTRIRRQLLAIGQHPADYPSLEDAELALVDLEIAGKLPSDIGRSPSGARETRYAHARSTGPAAIAASEWEHMAAAAADVLGAGDARRLADLEAVSIQDGCLIVTGSAETLDWAKAVQLPRLLEHVGRQLDIAHSVALIASEHASVFRPTAELRGPADHRAARADRYADERRHRFAIGGLS